MKHHQLLNIAIVPLYMYSTHVTLVEFTRPLYRMYHIKTYPIYPSCMNNTLLHTHYTEIIPNRIHSLDILRTVDTSTSLH